jgi:hypothetical protein
VNLTKITGSSKSKAALVAAAAAVVAAPLVLGPASPAQAWAWDPHVKVQGQVSCGTYPNGKVTGLWLWTAEDGGRWTAYSGTRYAEPFARDLWKVPNSGTTVHYDIYCNGFKFHSTFGLQRPASGTAATRNLYYRYA